MARFGAGIGFVLSVGISSAAFAGGDSPLQEQSWAVHGQTTFVLQANSSFRSPYQGANSLRPEAQARETFDLTLYAGFKPWKGGEIWVSPELDQGFGLSNTLGVAAFPSGEAYKVGKRTPYPKLPRWFLRQTIDLGGAEQDQTPDLLHLARRDTSDRLVVTIGKMSVVDVFDLNAQAHDPRSDFMNWTVVDAGTFDYAANAWGYTYGAAAELYRGAWTIRAGAFDLSKVPNSEELDPSFRQFELDGEIEHRHVLGGRPGRIAVTVFANHGRMGRFADAILLARLDGGTADISAVRRVRTRVGVSFNLEQQLSSAVSVFAKGGLANGSVETYEFTDVDRTIAAGLTVNGASWKRAGDVVGVAGVVNAISRVHQQFFDAGGLGILVGDGRLPRPGDEQALEAFYDIAAAKTLHLTLDAQFVRRPGYNRDRGPVPFGGVRVHAEF